MASPECKDIDSPHASTAIKYIQALNEIGRQLELANENENSIERALILDRLLEEHDWFMSILEDFTSSQGASDS